jgi:hypothetical protein
VRSQGAIAIVRRCRQLENRNWIAVVKPKRNPRLKLRELGVRLDSEKTWQRVCEEVALAGDGRTAGTEACSSRCLRSEGSQFTIMKLNWTFRKSLQSTLNLTVIVPSS